MLFLFLGVNSLSWSHCVYLHNGSTKQIFGHLYIELNIIDLYIASCNEPQWIDLFERAIWANFVTSLMNFFIIIYHPYEEFGEFCDENICPILLDISGRKLLNQCIIISFTLSPKRGAYGSPYIKLNSIYIII